MIIYDSEKQGKYTDTNSDIPNIHNIDSIVWNFVNFVGYISQKIVSYFKFVQNS